MHIEDKKMVLEELERKGIFSKTSLNRFVNESSYTLRKRWAETINSAPVVSRYLNVYGHEMSKQKVGAFKDLCLIELQRCRRMPEVQNNDCVNKYMHIVERLHDGSFINQRAKLQEIADKLEIKLLRTIPTDKPRLIVAYLKVVCFYGNKKLYYTSDDKKQLDRLLTFVM